MNETKLQRWIRHHEGEIVIFVLLLVPITLMWVFT